VEVHLRTVIRLIAVLCLFAGFTFGQDRLQSQAGLQFAGLYNTDATAGSITDHTTGSLAVRASYADFFSKQFGVEASYAYTKNSQDYLVGGMETATVRTTFNQFTVAIEYRIPLHVDKLHPYALLGTGSVQFRPTGAISNPSGAAPENRGTFVYGAGIDFDLTPRIGMKAEYRGLWYTAPDFSLTNLVVSARTHLAEPSIGAYYRF
jgi:opacity protein-like surface antigen